MKIPNFDDVDLAIIAITVIVFIVSVIIAILLLLGVDPEKILTGMAFAGMAISAIAGLARGRAKNGDNDQNPVPPNT